MKSPDLWITPKRDRTQNLGANTVTSDSAYFRCGAAFAKTDPRWAGFSKLVAKASDQDGSLRADVGNITHYKY